MKYHIAMDAGGALQLKHNNGGIDDDNISADNWEFHTRRHEDSSNGWEAPASASAFRMSLFGAIGLTPDAISGRETGLHATAFDEEVRLFWERPHDGGLPITKYQYRQKGGQRRLRRLEEHLRQQPGATPPHGEAPDQRHALHLPGARRERKRRGPALERGDRRAERGRLQAKLQRKYMHCLGGHALQRVHRGGEHRYRLGQADGDGRHDVSDRSGGPSERQGHAAGSIHHRSLHQGRLGRVRPWAHSGHLQRRCQSGQQGHPRHLDGASRHRGLHLRLLQP